MIDAISRILAGNKPSIYLYGSLTLNDFRLGWSDIDIIVLTEKRISADQAQNLVSLRQKMLETEPANTYYRSFEGAMLTLSAFALKKPDCVVYWGTSGQRITNEYALDSFSLTELLQNGKLLHGKDIRNQLTLPTYADLYKDVAKHFNAIRRFAQTTDRSIYSFGWLLDICRGIYTLRTGAVTSKTKAGEWALKNNLCPVPTALKTALKVRKNPLAYRSKTAIWDYAETLAPHVQSFADVLEKELQDNLYKLQ